MADAYGHTLPDQPKSTVWEKGFGMTTYIYIYIYYMWPCQNSWSHNLVTDSLLDKKLFRYFCVHAFRS